MGRKDDYQRTFNLSRSQWSELIDEWILDERDRFILKRRLLDGVCFQQLADESCLALDSVKKRFYKAEHRLFDHI